MKKIFIICGLLALCTLTFFGCDNDKSENSNTEDSTENISDNSDATTYTEDSTEKNISDNSDVATYTVSWIDEKGSLLYASTVKHGEIPFCSYDVVDTAEWDYTLDGWSTSQGGDTLAAIPAATADTTYYACVSSVKRTYTVSFECNGGSAVSDVAAEYGASVQEPSAPTRDGYRFVGWFTDTALNVSVDWRQAITGNTTYYAAWLPTVDMGQYLSALLNGYKADPYTYIPQSMQRGYAPNAINKGDIITDYSSQTSVSAIPAQGFGEQWNMILENLDQSKIFFNTLSAVEGLSSISVAGFNNYISQNPSNTAEYSFTQGIYSISIKFDGQIMYYTINYTGNIGELGEQTVQIAMSFKVQNGERTVRIQIGDANAVKYTLTENSYEFAIKYMGIRRAYFSIQTKKDGTKEGHIYEFLTVSGKEIKSAADFFITDSYAVAIGNKADSMIVFEGYIVELYNISSGKLICYEVQETLASKTYDTYWFDLCQIEGFEKILCTEKKDNGKGSFRVNGSTDEWKVDRILTSRKFDIEFRTQYFYYYDNKEQKYISVKAELPMLFIQRNNLNTFTADVLSKNGITLSVNVRSDALEALDQYYDTLLPIFKVNKDRMTSDSVVNFIGNKR